jgi:hypothetical protein
MRNAAAIDDDDIARLYATIKQQLHIGARVVAEALAALGAIRDDLDPRRGNRRSVAAEGPVLYTATVTSQRWPAERYQAWLARSMQASRLA